MKLKNMIFTISILAGLFIAGCGCPAPKQAAVPPDPGLCSAPGMVASAMQYPVGDSQGGNSSTILSYFAAIFVQVLIFSFRLFPMAFRWSGVIVGSRS